MHFEGLNCINLRMSFIENIKNCIGESVGVDLGEFRATMFGFSSVYFEKIKSIVSYTKTEIVLGLKKGRVIISGNQLLVKKYCAGDVVVCGEISKIEKSLSL